MTRQQHGRSMIVDALLTTAWMLLKGIARLWLLFLRLLTAVKPHVHDAHV